MADDELWFAPLLKTARVVPREPEPLWEVRSADHHTWSALLGYQGKWGVEARLFRDGEFVIGYRFSTRAAASSTVTFEALMQRTAAHEAGHVVGALALGLSMNYSIGEAHAGRALVWRARLHTAPDRMSSPSSCTHASAN